MIFNINGHVDNKNINKVQNNLNANEKAVIIFCLFVSMCIGFFLYKRNQEKQDKDIADIKAVVDKKNKETIDELQSCMYTYSKFYYIENQLEQTLEINLCSSIEDEYRSTYHNTDVYLYYTINNNVINIDTKKFNIQEQSDFNKIIELLKSHYNESLDIRYSRD